MSIFRDFFVKEKPVFTGISRGLGGFGFGVSAAGGGGAPGVPLIPDQMGSGGVIEVTGGTIRHIFVSPGTFTSGPEHPGTISYLVLGGGGGGGGAHHGGGGGGGGLIEDLSHPVSAGTPYAITVGEGGIGGKGKRDDSTSTGVGGNGAPSTAFGAVGQGGGGGGNSQSSGEALPGGSGGGAGDQVLLIPLEQTQATQQVRELHTAIQVEQKAEVLRPLDIMVEVVVVPVVLVVVVGNGLQQKVLVELDVMLLTYLMLVMVELELLGLDGLLPMLDQQDLVLVVVQVHIILLLLLVDLVDKVVVAAVQLEDHPPMIQAIQ